MLFETINEPKHSFCSISCAKACGFDRKEIKTVDGYLSVCPGCVELQSGEEWPTHNVMLNASQVKFLKTVIEVTHRWNSDDPNEDLALWFDAFLEEYGFRLTFARISRWRGMYTIPMDVLAKVADIHVSEIPA